jgi:DNA-binding CsgD family transcriptional regulator
VGIMSGSGGSPEMSSVTRILAHIHEAALEPALWPAALDALAAAVGAVGAACILSDTQTGEVEWASFVGPSTGFKPEYVSHYAGLDPYRPVLEAAPSGRWLRLSQCMPGNYRRSEWYNDFVVKAGVGDILGARLFDSRAGTMIFGIHYGLYQERSDPLPAAQLDALFDALSKATRLHVKLCALGWKSAVTLRALDQVAAGVIVTDRDGRVIEINRVAERIARRGDGLVLRQGRLGMRRVLDNEKLARLIAAATADKTAASIGRMLVEGRGGRWACILTVAPLAADLAIYPRPLALLVVADPDAHTPSERDLAEFFGLSPAESRLAAGLLRGKRLRDIAADSGVRITTLRTQLSSILRKVGAERQSDLVRVLSSLPVVTARMPENT